MIGRHPRRGGARRHEASNRQRGERARKHLARQRRRDLRRRQSDERVRERARASAGDPGVWPCLMRAGLFVLCFSAGILLAGPIQQILTSVTGGGLARIETIAIQGNDHLSFEHVAGATGVAPGCALVDVVPAEVEARLAADPWIKQARVLRLPPSTLLVRVEERRGRAVLVAESGMRLVDESGNPFSSATDQQAAGLPRLVGGQDLSDDFAHAQLVTALALVDRMRAIGTLGLAPEGDLELHLPRAGEPEGWQVHARERNTWVILGRDHLMERFERLVELLENEEVNRSLSEGTRRIDLRFAGQAVLRSAARSEGHGSERGNSPT